MTQRNYNNVTTIGTLSAPLASSATSISTTGFTGFPTAPFTVTLDRNTATEEICLVSSVAGAVLTVTRGFDGTAAIAHSAGATIEHTAGAIEYREANVHVNATSGVHGATGNLVGDQGAQSIFDKTLVSPVAQADVTAGDAVVAYDPTGVRNLFRGIDSGGNDVITVDHTGGIHAPTLAVTGASTLTGALTANGGITVPAGKTVTANGGLTAASSTITGNETVGGTLGVTGAISGAAITGSGLVKGAGVESTAGATLAQIAAPAGVASKGQVWSQSDGGLYTRSGTNPAGRLPIFWGSGTVFPTTGLIAGDAFYRTDWFSQFRNTAIGWVQEGVAYITDAQRVAIVTTGLPSGTRVYCTDTKREFTWTGTFWRFSGGEGPHLIAHLVTASGAITNNLWSLFAFDAVDYDPWGMSTASGASAQVWKVPITGLYQLSGMVGFNPNPTGGRAVKWNRSPNGSTGWTDIAGAEGSHPVASSGIGSDVPTPARLTALNAGEYISLWAYQNSGVTLGVWGSNTLGDQVSTATVTFIAQTA